MDMPITRDTITIPFSDARCVAIISTWLHGPAGRVWVRRAKQSNVQATRWHLTLNEEGTDAFYEKDKIESDTDVTVVDLIPQAIREAISALIAEGTYEQKRIACDALRIDGAIDCYQADVIVQKAILGKVVFG